MTEKQIEKMRKYVELIRMAAMAAGDWDESYPEFAHKYHVLCDYLILRLEREMKG